ncbi:MAG: MFS transporter [Pleurocapsa sp. SU_196_0]|nr:MFS transporter [Pleurocapsa sp. SU_196_0]
MRTFAALSVPPYRRFLFSQFFSLIGSWLQASAMSWLVVSVLYPNNPAEATSRLGLLSAIQWMPSLVLSLFAGAMLDRVSRRVSLLLSQTTLMLVAIGLGLVVTLNLSSFEIVAALALCAGLANVFDIVARQSLVPNLVPRDLMPNAIALNSLSFNLSRILGGTVFGIIAPLGLSIVFFLNAASFLGVLYAIWNVRVPDPEPHGTNMLEDIRIGLRYVWQTREVKIPILLMFFLSLFIINFQVTIPTFARFALSLTEGGFGLLSAAFGLGAAGGAAFHASRSASDKNRLMQWGSLMLVVSVALLTLAPNVALACVGLALCGFGMILFNVSANSSVQLATPDHLRARVMSVYSLVFAGMAPPGALLTGWLMSALGPRQGLLLLAGAGLLSVLALAPRLKTKQHTATKTASSSADD